MKTYLCIVLTAFMIAVWGNFGVNESKKYHFVVKKDCLKSYVIEIHNAAFRKGWSTADRAWKDYIKAVGGKQEAYILMIRASSGTTSQQTHRF